MIYIPKMTKPIGLGLQKVRLLYILAVYVQARDYNKLEYTGRA